MAFCPLSFDIYLLSIQVKGEEDGGGVEGVSVGKWRSEVEVKIYNRDRMPEGL